MNWKNKIPIKCLVFNGTLLILFHLFILTTYDLLLALFFNGESDMLNLRNLYKTIYIVTNKNNMNPDKIDCKSCPFSGLLSL